MKVKLFIFHPHTLFVNGGGETMIQNVFENLKKNDIDTEFFNIYNRKTDFDIFHLFGSNNSVSELYTALSGENKTLIVSAIDFSNFSYLKLKLYKYVQKLYPGENTYKYRKKLFDYAKVIIANSKNEKKFLINYFGLDENKIEVVPVGVSSKFYKPASTIFLDQFKLRDYILCVGRINSRKNQIKTINALKDLDLDLVFIGREDPSEMDYFNKFKILVEQTDNVHWIGQLDNGSDMLASAYANAKAHILPSFPPEFPGIASMEAGLSGTRVITTKSPAILETFEDLIYYCEPTEESMYEVTIKALKQENDKKIREHLYNNYTWEEISKRIIKIYESCIFRSGN